MKHKVWLLSCETRCLSHLHNAKTEEWWAPVILHWHNARETASSVSPFSLITQLGNKFSVLKEIISIMGITHFVQL